MADIPTNHEQVRQMLWVYLKGRRAARKGAGAALGDWTRIPVPQVKMETGQVMNPGPEPYDISLQGDGRILLATMLGVWPGDLPNEDSIPVQPLVLDETADLVRMGVLRAHTGATDAYVITPHGAVCLDADDRDLPPFSQERVQQLRNRFAGAPDLDLLARHYGEAIAAYHAGLDLSATVMIGACYELGLHQVARALVAYDGRIEGKVPGTNNADRQALKTIGKGKPVQASKVEDLVHDVLVNGFGADLGEDLEWAKTCLRPNGHFVRNLRNAAGHPTGRAVDRDQIASYIMLFPDFFGRVRSIVGTVGGLP